MSTMSEGINYTIELGPDSNIGMYIQLCPSIAFPDVDDFGPKHDFVVPKAGSKSHPAPIARLQ